MLAKANKPAAGLVASIHPERDIPLPERFVQLATAVRKSLQMPVFAIVQKGDTSDGLGHFGPTLYAKVLAALPSLPGGKPMAIIVDSPGGLAGSAYRIATAIRRRCGAYVAVVPGVAKSAATLFCLGAARIIMGENAELGPLDAQVWHSHREERISSLEVVNAVDRLNAEALKAIHVHMIFWAEASGKSVSELLPIATKFVAEMMKPMLERIDSIEFTKHSRYLKIAEEYATRLLSGVMPPPTAENVAGRLTSQYPDHDFVIDFDEAKEIGLQVAQPKGDLKIAMDRLAICGDDVTILGLLEEQADESEESDAEVGQDGETRIGTHAPGKRRRRSVSRPEDGEAPAG